MEINPQRLEGCWDEGWSLDLHTLFSIPIEPDLGLFETQRPPIAQELYLLKYRGERHRIENIAKVVADFLNKHKSRWRLDLMIPIPPSDLTRNFQPVYELARAVGRLVGLVVDFDTLKKLKPTSQLKNIEDPEKRKEILKNAFTTDLNVLSGKNVLIFDDLYRSGATLNAACEAIVKQGKAKSVYALTITKTRSRR